MPPYRLIFKNTALKFLEATIPAKIQGQVKKKIEKLREDAHPQGCKKLNGVTHNEDAVYRMRSRDYRILYIINEKKQTIIIIDIDNRKDIYR